MIVFQLNQNIRNDNIRLNSSFFYIHVNKFGNLFCTEDPHQYT